MLFLAFSCTQKEKNSTAVAKNQHNILSEDDLSTIIAFDTLSTAATLKKVDEKLASLQNTKNEDGEAYYNYFAGIKFHLEKKRDSAKIMFESIVLPKDNQDLFFLKNISLLNLSINNGVAVESEIMDRIHQLTETAETQKSKLTYKLYDLLAKAYYQNHDDKTSLQYVEKYYANHPFKNHPIIVQRYYDISFMLASRMSNYEKMLAYNAKARKLALSIKDSLAIARTYDNEAQIYGRQLDYVKALTYSKIHTNYLLKTDNINDVAYYNLAISFQKNKKVDSAIYYYKQAIALNQKLAPGKPKYFYYTGLMDAYKLQGNYKLALASSEEANAIQLKTIKEIEAVKVAEIKEKYEAEKKDKNIVALQSRNKLSEKVIEQQKVTMILSSLVFLAVITFLYFSYRQRQLKQKNKLLNLENKRLNMEQKLLQVQLNPHFIFNSIANLQSLASAGNTKDTVRYLNVFSGLLRNILEQSRKDFITLEEEVATLENYLKLQQMRYKDLFDYKITTANTVYLPGILIPPMLIQPFVENAIEHGFRNIDYKGLLTLNFSVENEQLIIVVDDNGKGIEIKNPNDQKKQSLAGVILKERLDVIFNSQGQNAKYEQTDKKQLGNHGYVVRISIPELKD
ncbi:histidine kinase [Pedobacter changchengzhani]|nr:histidine kinase [Pedobacter changchengzhani]